MTLHLEIPSSVAKALRLPATNLRKQLLIELALSLYEREILSFGKARELAEMDKLEFALVLGRRKILRHYGEEELKDDLAYASRE